MYLLNNNPEESFNILKKIEKAQAKHPQDRVEAKLNLNLGSYYAYLNKYDEAIDCFNKTIDYCIEYNFKPIKLCATASKAEVLLKLNQIEEAESILLKEYKDYKMENISAYKNIINLLIEICVLNENSVERKKYEDELELICNH